MSEAMTYLITQSQVRELLDMAIALEAVERGFRLYGEGRVQMPPKPYLRFDRGDLRCMPAYAAEFGVATVKNVNVHPSNTDLPTVIATLTLIDPGTGFPLAIMDGTYLTAVRTGAAGGVAARYLSREDARVAGIVGAGRQARTQLEALLMVRPGVERLLVCDAQSERAAAFAREATEAHGVEAWPEGVQETVRAADVLITVTPVRKPIVRADWVRAGTHINAIGADARGKQELEPDLLARAKIVVDSWEQGSHAGEINVAVSSGLLSRGDIHADIGEVVAGSKPGRQSPAEVTVFDSTGLAIQDCACAAAVWRRLQASGRLADCEVFEFF